MASRLELDHLVKPLVDGAAEWTLGPLAYAGIGSRMIPDDIRKLMGRIASFLEKKGFILRSGNADGSDDAFARGVVEKAEIFLPWEGFNQKYIDERPKHKYIVVGEDDEDAYASIEKFHPNKLLSGTAKKFMARNYRQVFGPKNQNSMSLFVICWTLNGEVMGGTGQAMRIADYYKIPIINLAIDSDREFIKELMSN